MRSVGIASSAESIASLSLVRARIHSYVRIQYALKEYRIVFEFRMGFQKDDMPSAVSIWRCIEHKYSRDHYFHGIFVSIGVDRRCIRSTCFYFDQ